MTRWLLLASLALAGCLVDVTHDGVVVVACVGDSLTAANYLPRETGWCEQLALPGSTSVRNYAAGGATWQGNVFPATGGPGCAAQTTQAIAEGADIIVAACGTNVVGVQPAGSWATAATTAVLGPAQAAGRQAYLLGIPLIDLTKSPASTGFNQAVFDANLELAAVAGPHWIASPPLAATDYAPDGLHLLTSGQAVRALAVRTILLH
jgi:hypothetical protein